MEKAEIQILLQKAGCQTPLRRNTWCGPLHNSTVVMSPDPLSLCDGLVHKTSTLALLTGVYHMVLWPGGAFSGLRVHTLTVFVY